MCGGASVLSCVSVCVVCAVSCVVVQLCIYRVPLCIFLCALILCIYRVCLSVLSRVRLCHRVIVCVLCRMWLSIFSVSVCLSVLSRAWLCISSIECVFVCIVLCAVVHLPCVLFPVVADLSSVMSPVWFLCGCTFILCLLYCGYASIVRVSVCCVVCVVCLCCVSFCACVSIV